MYVKDLMTTNLFIVNENDKIQSVSNILHYKHVRHIPVVNNDNILVGLITFKELLRGLSQNAGDVYAKDIMNSKVISVEPTTPVIGALDVMIINKYGCLPIVDSNKKLLGIISEIDMLRLLYKNCELPDDWYLDNNGISFKGTRQNK